MDTKVSTLISASRWWDVPKVYSLFTFMEVETRWFIPLVCDNVDRIIWHFTTHGRYTVKSGYWASLEYQNLTLNHTSAGTSFSPSQKLWNPHGCISLPILDRHWHPPQVGYLQLNVDGALDLRDGLRRVGLIVRDSHNVLIIESDSLAIVWLLSKEEECLALEGVLVTEIGVFS
ncbi:PREDICTED: pathogenesis-related STH-21 [Prunus dulcis]|uniref:PREDICTED: pathogenesis-related STH-21 n=1 Tax=Prunus dulcis TaxID=3755 RepID=A0A5E4G9W6_PRUDU|nr:hypothetical protein L3X38_003052 [Prunus dulcis]VVA36382.1 PREDICTED: pathogenesis-related STH-21 [Prunus dulcis]